MNDDPILKVEDVEVSAEDVLAAYREHQNSLTEAAGY